MNKTVYLIKDEGKYIAAIVQGTKALAKYLHRIDKELLPKLTIEGIRGRYPFQILETADNNNDRHFWILDTDYLQKSFAKDLAANQPEKVPVTLYDIKKDFLGDPENPGADYMGILPHDHFGEHDDE